MLQSTCLIKLHRSVKFFSCYLQKIKSIVKFTSIATKLKDALWKFVKTGLLFKKRLLTMNFFIIFLKAIILHSLLYTVCIFSFSDTCSSNLAFAFVRYLRITLFDPFTALCTFILPSSLSSEQIFIWLPGFQHSWTPLFGAQYQNHIVRGFYLRFAFKSFWTLLHVSSSVS